MKSFLCGISRPHLTSVLKNLDQYRRKLYESPRVMQQALNYINTAVSLSHAHSWKLIKPHMLQIIQDIVFPLMSYSEADTRRETALICAARTGQLDCVRHLLNYGADTKTRDGEGHTALWCAVREQREEVDT